MAEQLAGQVREFAELDLGDRDRLRSFGEGRLRRAQRHRLAAVDVTGSQRPASRSASRTMRWYASLLGKGGGRH
jgi:hypothetical protein